MDGPGAPPGAPNGAPDVAPDVAPEVAPNGAPDVAPDGVRRRWLRSTDSVACEVTGGRPPRASSSDISPVELPSGSPPRRTGGPRGSGAACELLSWYPWST